MNAAIPYEIIWWQSMFDIKTVVQALSPASININIISVDCGFVKEWHDEDCLRLQMHSLLCEGLTTVRDANWCWQDVLEFMFFAFFAANPHPFCSLLWQDAKCATTCCCWHGNPKLFWGICSTPNPSHLSFQIAFSFYGRGHKLLSIVVVVPWSEGTSYWAVTAGMVHWGQNQL